MPNEPVNAVLDYLLLLTRFQYIRVAFRQGSLAYGTQKHTRQKERQAHSTRNSETVNHSLKLKEIHAVTSKDKAQTAVAGMMKYQSAFSILGITSISKLLPKLNLFENKLRRVSR
jgi:hypothetical protein